MLAFVHRMPCREDDSSTAKDLSKVRRNFKQKFLLNPFFLLLICVFIFQQLHSSVRTGNLETCLRLLSLGAQANFFHPVRSPILDAFVVSLGSSRSSQRFLPLQEKGNTPLHVAARAGQVSQAELLTVYGADPGAPDSNGKTPIDYARSVSSINPNLMNLCSLKCGTVLFPNFAGKPDTMSWQIVWWRFSTSSPIDWRSTCVGEDQVSSE